MLKAASMGKLTITVNQCRLMRLSSWETVNPCIHIEVDGLYKFQTRRIANTFSPTFDESFFVSNTHRFAVVTVNVYHVSNASSNRASEGTLLGGCNLSVEWAFRSRKRSRKYVLVSKDNLSLLGFVDITLKSDFKGDAIRFSDEEEDAYVKRLTRFLMLHDRSLLRKMDLIMSSVKGVKVDSQRDSLHAISDNDDANTGPLVTSNNVYETFEELMNFLCNKYDCAEPLRKPLLVTVEGCTGLEKPLTYLPSNCFVVIRTECEECVTTERPFSCNPSWVNEEFELDVLDPNTHALRVMVVRQLFQGKCRALGRAVVRVNTLSLGRHSTRQVFIFRYKEQLVPTITGVVHLVLRTDHWEVVPRSLASRVNDYYTRLNRFFYRYDRRRLPQVDSLIHSRLYNLEDLISELEILYGREPGTMELRITVHDLYSLQNEKRKELDGEEVEVVVKMGEYVMRTQPKRVKANFRSTFGETFVIDVARETNMIRIEVRQANRNKTIYGRNDFACVMLQRGVENRRVLFLVGKAATDEAYLSGMVSVAFYSEQLGQSSRIDLQTESMYSGRFRRYVQTYIPSKLHLVDIAVCTVFDFDNFLLDIAREHGEESETYVVYVNILGCRELKSRLGFGMNAYVVARMGVERYETHVVRNNTEPDFFHFVEFYFDSLKAAKMTLFVMDRYDFGSDRVVGRVDIELGKYKLEEDHHIWFNIYSPNKPEGSDPVGLVGAKFIVKNLSLMDSIIHGQEDLSHLFHTQQDTKKVARKKPSSQRRRKLEGWRNNIDRLAAHLLRRSSASLNGFSELSHSRTSECETMSSSGSFSLMDERLHSANEFCLQEIDTLTPTELTAVSPSTFSSTYQTNGKSNTDNSFDMNDLFIYDVPLDLLKEKRKIVTGSSQEKKLRVRVVCCRNLHSSQRTLPSPYVMLSTLLKTHQTRRHFGTVSPKFNEEFLFSVENPTEDFLSIIVVTETSYGKKCLGHCVLSMKNVQRDTPRTRWVSLISEPNSLRAKQNGFICLTITGENFGLDYLPSIEEENGLRKVLTYTLQSKLPKELHRTEYYIAEYSFCEGDLMRALSNSVKNQIDTNYADVTLTVAGVTQLFFNDHLVGNCACVIKAKINGKTISRTSPVYGANGCFNIKQTYKMSISSSAGYSIRVVVYINEKRKLFKCGECLVSLEGSHLSVAEERTHILVKNPGLDNAKPVGFITLSFRNNACEYFVVPLVAETEKQYIRVRDYYFYYLKPRLHSVDVEYRSTINMEAHLQNLINTYGPEPSQHSLRVQIKRCCSLQIYGGSPFCILRVGLQQYKTSIAAGVGEYTFFETFNLQIGLPEKEEVQLFLMLVLKNADGCIEVEAGRTVVPIGSTKRGFEVHLNLPLVDFRHSEVPAVNGSVEVTLFTDDFGNSTDILNSQPVTGINANGHVENVLENHLDECYRLPYFACDANVHEGQGSNFTYSATSTTSARISILLVALIDFPEQHIYIRAKVNNNVLLRTGIMEGDRFGCINERIYLESTCSALDSVIALKIAKRHLGRYSVLCFCEFAVCNCQRGTVTTKFLRLFDSKGHSMGRLQVKIDIPADIRGLRIPNVSASDLESISDDIASLMAKYIPQELCRLDVTLSRSNNLRELHHVMRQHHKKSTLSTVYFVVHRIDLLDPVEGPYVVEVSSKDDVVRAAEPRGAARAPQSASAGGPRRPRLSPLRVDLSPDFDALLLRVLADGEAPERGRAAVSLRALLTPALYDLGETVCLPLVRTAPRQRQRQRQRHSSAAAAAGDFAGTITFSLAAPLFEKFPPAVRLSAAQWERWRVSRPLVRCYFERICSLLKHYDAHSLVHIHHLFYEEYVAKEDWAVYVENFFNSLLERWGPEVETFDFRCSSS